MTSKVLSNKINNRVKRGLIYGLAFLITFILMLSAVAPKKYNIQEGEIAKADIKAQKDTVDQEATNKLIVEAKAKIEKKYTKTDIDITAKDQVANFFSEILNINKTDLDINKKIERIKEINNFNLKDSQIEFLLKKDSSTIDNIKNTIDLIIDEVYKDNIEENNNEQLAQARLKVQHELSDVDLDDTSKVIVKDICYEKIQPNLIYDKERTEEELLEAEKNVQKVMIKKNQIILNEGQQVTKEDLRLLKELGLLNENRNGNELYVYAILAAYIILVQFLQYYYLYSSRLKIYNDIKLTLLIIIINLLTLVLATGINIISPFLIPLACAPLLLSLLIDYRASIILSSFNILLLSVIVEFSTPIVLLAIVNVVIGSVILKNLQQRNDILRAALYIGAVTTVLTFLIGVITTNDITEVLKYSGYNAIGTVLSGVLAVGILPFLENGFDVVTNVKLLELSNPNNPLLRKLLMEAPGTYHHSMMVANLAEVATEEVGGNPIVARIGAYYHDIGKTKRPYFFAENQMGKENPHNKITPNLSTLIIISHAKDGLELAKEEGLPKVIQDIIIEHHGTTLVKYFYYNMKKNAERPEDIKEEDFKYTGPTPRSKESGIVMLADSVEAAVRSINEPTKGKIEEMVNNIIKDKLNCNQLAECDLTMKDLEVIRKCFLRVLNGIYHQRIEYPTEKKIKQNN